MEIEKWRNLEMENAEMRSKPDQIQFQMIDLPYFKSDLEDYQKLNK